VATQAMVDSVKQATPAEDIQERRYSTIPAANFQYAQAGKFRIIPGLGITGKGVTLAASNPSSQKDTALRQQPFLEYKVTATVDKHTIKVQCMPTQSVTGSGKLRYAISVNNDTPQIINVHTESETNTWKQNVLRGFSAGTTTHQIKHTGISTIRIYVLDEGLVLTQLTIE
jgi:hypothetical protein